jgi:N-acetylglucosamine-6-phosphate deacetylase
MLTVRGRHYLTGDLLDFCLADGLISAIHRPSEGVASANVNCDWVAPGLLDLQVNGYRGNDFCRGDVTADQVVAVAGDLADAGVTGFCPTVTTNSFASMEASLRAIARACETSGLARDRILGIHLEGPYISPEDGPRGAHPREHARVPDWDEFTRFQIAAGGRIRVVTLAPELTGALDFIARASRAGLVVALGHHAATREQIHAAVFAGAVLCTHLGNGAHSLLPRHPNYIWEQLAHDGLMASLIVDGHHLPASVVKSFYRVKGPARLILVSDTIAAAGLPPGKHHLMGMEIQLMEDGSVRLSGTPYLAGSVLKLCDAIDLAVRFCGASLADAIAMATTNPARLLGVERERGLLTTGTRADLALFRAAPGRFELAGTISGGEMCYQLQEGRRGAVSGPAA